jgi:hypothetical protein
LIKVALLIYQSKPIRTRRKAKQSSKLKTAKTKSPITQQQQQSIKMFQYPYNYKNKVVAHEKIYGDCDIYYYTMRILCNYLSSLEKFQGIRKIDLENFDDVYNMGYNITNRIMVCESELPNDTVVYKLIRSIKKEHFLKYIKTYCKDKEISYTTNLNRIDMREFLMYACSELITDYKHEMIEGWEGNKWEKVESKECKTYSV